MKKIVFLMIFLVSSTAHAVDALWQFGGENGVDYAWGYELAWGAAPGQYTNSIEILKSQCAPAVVSGVTYNCKVTFPANALSVGVRYYVTVSAWNYAANGIDKEYSAGNPTVEFVHREPGASPGTKPSPPKSIRILSTVP